jgi:threonine/homoserine/homoserine lactone efflux protein
MIEGSVYQLFLLTALIIVITPGPDTILVLSRTLATGGGAGLMTLLGTQTGNVIHAVLAGLGVSTLVLMVPWMFDFLKYLGAGYLIYLAIKLWYSSESVEINSQLTSSRNGYLQYFYQGLINNLVNPKMIPFFIAIFPQFINPEKGNLALQSFFLGITLAVMAILILGIAISVATKMRNVISESSLFLNVANKFAAFVFLGLAIRLLTQRNT